MRIGSSIALIAVGLILALAVNIDVEGLDLDLIGWILAAVGVVGLLVSLALARRTRRCCGTTRSSSARSATRATDRPAPPRGTAAPARTR